LSNCFFFWPFRASRQWRFFVNGPLPSVGVLYPFYVKRVFFTFCVFSVFVFVSFPFFLLQTTLHPQTEKCVASFVPLLLAPTDSCLPPCYVSWKHPFLVVQNLGNPGCDGPPPLVVDSHYRMAYFFFWFPAAPSLDSREVSLKGHEPIVLKARFRPKVATPQLFPCPFKVLGIFHSGVFGFFFDVFFLVMGIRPGFHF